MTYKTAKWKAIYNHAGGGELGTIVANKMLLRSSSLIAKSKRFRRITLEMDKTNGEFIKKADNGDNYVDFILTDTSVDSQGDSYTSELLEKWADEINAGNAIIGDFNHEEYDRIIATNFNKETIIEKLLHKKGIAKAVKAIFDKGKLWVKAIIDKRYRNAINKARGISLEALIEDTDGNVATKGNLLGFTFTANGTQVNSGAVVV